jgi:hypothetical protein
VLRNVYHFIREHVANKTIDLTFVGTADMVADLFTKALDRVARGEVLMRAKTAVSAV